MSATTEPPASGVVNNSHPLPTRSRGEGVPFLARGEGVELLGPMHGSGYRDGAALVRRADGQMVQLGPLMYAMLESVDGQRGAAELADAISGRAGGAGRRAPNPAARREARQAGAAGGVRAVRAAEAKPSAGAPMEGARHRPG